METPKCNPIELLEQFALEYYPTFNRHDKHIDIADDGDRWEITYVTPVGQIDLEHPEAGGGFPVVLVVDKKACKIVKAKVYQD